jgi:hypothetical protein
MRCRSGRVLTGVICRILGYRIPVHKSTINVQIFVDDGRLMTKATAEILDGVFLLPRELNEE